MNKPKNRDIDTPPKITPYNDEWPFNTDTSNFFNCLEKINVSGVSAEITKEAKEQSYGKDTGNKE